ncbi:MAG: hypothetical protein J7M34_03805 [Anaerolineae bacterium]|nr:hypothetical protein [Anaerolineae bacterium]
MRQYIAIGVDAKRRIWGGHFGIAPLYQIYDLDGKLLEERQNPYGAGAGQKIQHHDDPKLIIELLSECRVFIGRRMGDHSKEQLEKRWGITTVLTSERSPEEALKAYLEG